MSEWTPWKWFWKFKRNERSDYGLAINIVLMIIHLYTVFHVLSSPLLKFLVILLIYF